MSDSKIHKAIVSVMREIGAIGKDEENTQQKYKYRSIEAVYNRVQPLFAKYGIFSYPKVLEQSRETGQSKSGGAMHYAVLTVEYVFSADDGSSIAVVVVGEGMDSGDKASNKAMAAAHKYAICQVLNIPYQVIDPDAFAPEWAAGLNGSITYAQLNELKKLWAEAKAKDLNGKDRNEKKLAFKSWVLEMIGEDFDTADFRQWTPEDLERCAEALNAKERSSGSARSV